MRRKEGARFCGVHGGVCGKPSATRRQGFSTILSAEGVRQRINAHTDKLEPHTAQLDGSTRSSAQPRSTKDQKNTACETFFIFRLSNQIVRGTRTFPLAPAHHASIFRSSRLTDLGCWLRFGGVRRQDRRATVHTSARGIGDCFARPSSVCGCCPAFRNHTGRWQAGRGAVAGSDACHRVFSVRPQRRAAGFGAN